MAHAFAFELLWYPFVQRNGPQPSHHQRRVFLKWSFWCASIALGLYSSSYLWAPRPYISLILDLIFLPPSPTGPTPMVSDMFLQTSPTIHYDLSTTDDRAKLLAEQAKHVHNASDSKSHSPAPLLTPLRLWPHQASPDRCNSLVRVRRREP